MHSNSPDNLDRKEVSSALDEKIPKFTVNEVKESLRFFSKSGYAIYKGIYDAEDIVNCREYIFKSMKKLESIAEVNSLPFDRFGFAQASMNALQKQCFYENLEANESVCNILLHYLGPDIAKIGWDQIWYNLPKSESTVLVKNIHTDAWTGTSVNTLFWKLFLTGVEFANTLGICPGSHLLGLVPVRNRAIDSNHGDLLLDYLALDCLEAGDVVIWHPFLLHFSVGTGKKCRCSITMRYSSIHTPFSSQEKGLGYKSISNGPMGYIMRVIGSDYASPFRVLGGSQAIDRRLISIYPTAPRPITEFGEQVHDWDKLLKSEEGNLS